MKKTNIATILLILPSLLGFTIFYILPFCISIVYALVNNNNELKFVGLDNFIMILNNKTFILGLKNTIIFIIISVPLNLIIGLCLGCMIQNIKKYKNIYVCLFLLPLMIPSSSITFFWKNLVSYNGVVNGILNSQGYEIIDFFNNNIARFVIIMIYLWKNVGYNIILFIAGLNNIPKEYYENAYIEGANIWQQMCITIIYLAPTIFIVLIMSIINSFKVFKEVFMVQGSHPHESVYMVQHFLNNVFKSLNYQKLISGSYILTIIIVLIVLILFIFEKYIFSRSQ